MREAYLIDCFDTQGSTVRLPDLFEQKRLPYRGVQEIHIFGEPQAASQFIPGETLSASACFTWPGSGHLVHYVIQSSCRAITCAERDMVLITEIFEGGAAVLLLASPSAVGKYNITPRARFALHLNLAGSVPSLYPAVQSSIETAGEDPREVFWLTDQGQPAPGSQNDSFPNIQQISPDPVLPGFGSLLLNRLVDQLERSRHRFGLWVSKEAGQPYLVTLMERL
jgi:hypothetical protein